jgi:hypothetical protein
MTIHPLAGKPVPKDLLVDTDNLRREYYTRKPDFTDRGQRVSFGTSGIQRPTRCVSSGVAFGVGGKRRQSLVPAVRHLTPQQPISLIGKLRIFGFAVDHGLDAVCCEHLDGQLRTQIDVPALPPNPQLTLLPTSS